MDHAVDDAVGRSQCQAGQVHTDSSHARPRTEYRRVASRRRRYLFDQPACEPRTYTGEPGRGPPGRVAPPAPARIQARSDEHDLRVAIHLTHRLEQHERPSAVDIQIGRRALPCCARAPDCPATLKITSAPATTPTHGFGDRGHLPSTMWTPRFSKASADSAWRAREGVTTVTRAPIATSRSVRLTADESKSAATSTARSW